ncbi:MAG: hypothetical protein QOD56_3300 [Gammaproteobacteria bacterium]|nr:hypothetical protein [Gammaproteobacteria bacterium]
MDAPTIKFPVTCPQCGKESLAEYRVVAVTIALFEWGSMRLYADCHQVFWDASVVERGQIREYLGTSWLGAGPSSLESHAAVPPNDIRKRKASGALPGEPNCGAQEIQPGERRSGSSSLALGGN